MFFLIFLDQWPILSENNLDFLVLDSILGQILPNTEENGKYQPNTVICDL